MAVPVRSTWFRAFRITVFTTASILSVVWSILIAIYTVKNWSSYETGQRVFFACLVALDFVSSILIYLMIVVHFTYWPDVARALALTGLHGAAAVMLMVLKPNLPCNAFGGWTVCDRMTNAIIVGTWVIAGLLAAYALCLPFVARSQGNSGAVPDVEKTSDQKMDAERTEQDGLVEDDKLPESPSTGAQAWLLKDQEGMSPETIPMSLPRLSDNGRTHSPASSSLTSVTLRPQPGARLPQDITKSDYGMAGLPEPTYWSPSPRNNASHLLSPPSGPVSDTTAPVSSRLSSSPMLPHPFAAVPPPGIDHNGGNSIEEALFLMQQRSSANIDGYESPSVYSHPSAASHVSTLTTIRPTNRQLAKEEEDLADPLITPVQEDLGADTAGIEGPKGGYLKPPLTAFPVSDYSSAGPGASQTTFELQLSRPPSIDASDLLNMVAGVPRPHTRKDSAISIVDMDEWRKLVLGAAGKT